MAGDDVLSVDRERDPCAGTERGGVAHLHEHLARAGTDRDGIGVTVGEVDVAAPPLDRLDPVAGDQRKRPQL